ncbi:MAG: acyl carrier protein [Bacillota bacterium]
MFEKVKAILVEELDVDEAKVTKDANIIDDLGADSLDVVEMIMALEDAFDITVNDDEAQKLRTVQDVVAYIEKVN